MPLAPAAILDRADDRLKNGSLPKLFVEEQRHVLRPRRVRGDRDLHRLVDQRRVHADFFGLLVLPVEALGKVRSPAPRADGARALASSATRSRSCARAGAMTKAARTSGSARRSMAYLLAKLQYSAATHVMRARFRAVLLRAGLSSSVALAAARQQRAAEASRSRPARPRRAGTSTTSSTSSRTSSPRSTTPRTPRRPCRPISRSAAAAARRRAAARPADSLARASSRSAIRFPAGQVAGDRCARAVPRRHRRRRRRGPRPRSAAGEAVPELHAADAMAQAEHIREEGARYNLGNMRSTLGNPVLALGVLQRSYQPRFRFSLGEGRSRARARTSGSSTTRK